MRERQRKTVIETRKTVRGTKRMKEREIGESATSREHGKGIPLPLASHRQTPQDSTSPQQRSSPCEMAGSPPELQETETPIIISGHNHGLVPVTSQAHAKNKSQ